MTRHLDRTSYFTEEWVGAPGNLRKELTWQFRELIIAPAATEPDGVGMNLASTRAWNRTPTGADLHQCLGAVTIDETKSRAIRLTTSSRSVQIRAGRIGAHCFEHHLDIVNVAFKTAGRRHVLIVLNNGRDRQTVRYPASRQGS